MVKEKDSPKGNKIISSKLIIGAIAVIIILALAFVLISDNSHFTKEKAIFKTIDSSCASSQCTIVGDNFSSLKIKVDALSQVNTPMANITINATANFGNVTDTCITNSSGLCTLNYIAPKTASTLKAAILLDANNVTKSLSITVNPDVAASLLVKSNAGSLLANGASSTIVLAKATDDHGSVVPNGTKIGFSLNPSNEGSLSASSCITINGACNVTYTTSTTPGNATIDVFSGNANASISLSLLKPQFYTKSVMPKEAFSLQCSYYKDKEFTVPNSAYNVTVTGSFASNGGPVNFAILTPNQMASLQSAGYITSLVYGTGETVGTPFNYTLSGGTYYVLFFNDDDGNIGCYFNPPTISVTLTSPITLSYYD